MEMLVTLILPDASVVFDVATFTFLPNASQELWHMPVSHLVDQAAANNGGTLMLGEYAFFYFFEGHPVSKVTFTVEGN